jgi:hypothetical protein
VNANGIGLGKYLQVKVTIDISKPLARGRIMNVKGKQIWVAFQYERLPKFPN